MIPLHVTYITTSGKSVACDIFTNHAARRFLFSGYNIYYVLMPMSLVECSTEIKSSTARRKQIIDSRKSNWLHFNRKPGQMIPVVKLNQTYSVQPIIHQKLMWYIVTISEQYQRLRTPLFAKPAYWSGFYYAGPDPRSWFPTESAIRRRCAWGKHSFHKAFSSSVTKMPHIPNLLSVVGLPFFLWPNPPCLTLCFC